MMCLLNCTLPTYVHAFVLMHSFLEERVFCNLFGEGFA